MTSRQFQKLKEMIGPRQLSNRPATLRKYSGDAWYAAELPEAVAMPRHTEHVRLLVNFCRKHRIPITPRGAGRGYVGGCVPVRGGVVLSLHRMNRIREISVADSVAIVEPGVITADLQNAARKKGMSYPPDPASLKESSIGGNIASNAGGPRCLKYGVTGHYVLGLEVVLPNGDVVQTGGKTHKNKTGFKLNDLFIGSEGMLGIITEATLKLIPAPPARAGLVATFSTATQAAKVVTAIQKHGLLPAALEVADSLTLDAARKFNPATPDGDAFILTELDGQSHSVRGELAQIKKIVQQFSPVSVRTAFGEKEVESLWDMRRDFSYGLKATGLTKLNEDVTVPRGRLLDLFRFGRRLQKETGLMVACFGHAGDGNIHTNLMVQADRADSPEVRAALDRLFNQVIAWEGKITGEHGVGLAKKAWWKNAVSPELDRLHHSIKNALDPHDILNPGKFLDPGQRFTIYLPGATDPIRK